MPANVGCVATGSLALCQQRAASAGSYPKLRGAGGLLLIPVTSTMPCSAPPLCTAVFATAAVAWSMGAAPCPAASCELHP
jgi:hypothetical protein